MFILQTVQKIEESSKDALKRMTVANSKEIWKSFMFRGSVGVWIVVFFLQKIDIEHLLEML